MLPHNFAVRGGFNFNYMVFQKGNKINLGRNPSKKARINMSNAQKGKPRPWNQGEKNGKWKGGKYKTSDGYIAILKPNHPFCNKQGYIKEHRLICEKALGCYLKSTEIPHHINGIVNDNRPENLYLFKTSSKHIKFHRLKNKPLLESNLN